jgi:hypothetical protein
MKYIKLFKSQVLQESFLANDNGQVDRPHFSFCDATDNFGLDSDVTDYVEPEPVDPSTGGGDEPGGGDTPTPEDPSTGGDTPGGDDNGGETPNEPIDEPGD